MTAADVVCNLRNAASLLEEGLVSHKRVVEELEVMLGTLRGESWVDEAVVVDRDRIGKLLDRVAALRPGAAERTNDLIDAKTLLLDMDSVLGILEGAEDEDLGDAVEHAYEVLS